MRKTQVAIRTCKDLAATMLHRLGYWPRNSLVILALAEKTIGPCLRVDLPPNHREAADYLRRLCHLMPATLDGVQSIDRYVVFYCTDDPENLRERQLSTSTRRVPTRYEREQDVRAVTEANRWVSMLNDTAVTGGLICHDFILLGATTLWGLQDRGTTLAFTGFIEDVLLSTYHMAQTVCGKSIATTAEQANRFTPWKTSTTNNQQMRDDWASAASLWQRTYAAEQASFASHPPHVTGTNPYTYCMQKSTELCYWDTAIEVTRWMMRTAARQKAIERSEKAESTAGDKLRRVLPAEVAGYLIASLNTAGTAHLVLYDAAVSLRAPLQVLNSYYLRGTKTQSGGIQEKHATTRYRVTQSKKEPKQIALAEVIEPNHYGLPSYPGKTLPASFTFTLDGRSAKVAPPSGVRTSWRDWVRRTHCTLQTGFLGVEKSPERVEHRYYPQRLSGQPIDNAQKMARLLCGIEQNITPRWNRLNALEVLCSLLTHSAEGKELGYLRNIQAWVNWMRGNSSYANLLHEEASRHGACDSSLNYALTHGLLPRWLADPARSWSGSERFSSLQERSTNARGAKL